MTESDQSKPPGRTARRASSTRRKLLDAALSRFAEVGVDACSIQDITERADVGKGTFYRHFEDKQALVSTLVQDSVGRLIENLRSRKGQYRTLDDALAHLFDVHARFYNDRPETFILLFQSRLLLKLRRHGTEELGRLFQSYLGEIEQQLTPLVPPPADPVKVRRLACALTGYVSGYFSMAMISMKQEDIVAGMEALRQAFLAGTAQILR